MKSGLRELHWNTPMPASTQRRHESTTRGDNKGAILRCSRERPGRDRIRALDGNFQCVRRTDGFVMPVMMHWTTPGRNGYKFYIDANGHRRKMTRAQLRKPAQKWGYEGVRSWRRANGERVLNFPEAIAFAAKHGVVICAELKSRSFAVKAVAEYMHSVYVKYDHPAWTMALLKMKMCSQKCAAQVNAGNQFAVIFGNFRRMATGANKFKGWSRMPTQVWGPATAKRWLAALKKLGRR